MHFSADSQRISNIPIRFLHHKNYTRFIGKGLVEKRFKLLKFGELFVLNFYIFSMAHPVFIVLSHFQWVFNLGQRLNRRLVCKMPLSKVILQIQTQYWLVIAILLHEVVQNIRTDSRRISNHKKRWWSKKLLWKIRMLQHTRLHFAIHTDKCTF